MSDAPLPLGLQGRPGEKLSTMAYNTLRELIVYGGFEPGERLYPGVLSEQFGISVTPVKEAFTRLHAEGYLEAIPRRGYSVTVPTTERITELWQVRSGLEVTAGEIVIEKLAAGTLDQAALDTLDRRLEELARHGASEHRAHIEHNAAFHLQIVELAGNDVLTEIYNGASQQAVSAWVQTGLSSWQERLPAERTEHIAIVTALRAGDEKKFRAALKAHLQRSLVDAISDLKKKPVLIEGRKT